MNESESIKILSNFDECVTVKADGVYETDRYIQAKEVAIKALEKQIPKKVNARKIMKDFHDKPYAIKGDCPSCGMVGLLSVNTDYCHCCGQKLDWSAADERK